MLSKIIIALNALVSGIYSPGLFVPPVSSFLNFNLDLRSFHAFHGSLGAGIAFFTMYIPQKRELSRRNSIFIVVRPDLHRLPRGSASRGAIASLGFSVRLTDSIPS